ncbi:unnamed protein product [Adineta ricciae]|uniref:EF-hand domain-containing protein n=1 Tax=Adineta ricciae TaxID=249248 RepID=A0A815E7L9_ADIRI|nr:unnamed protein product [Adineta ricciae]
MGNDASKGCSTPLSDLEIAVLIANSRLSEKEIRAMYDDFQKNGGEGDGKISRDEFEEYYQKTVGIDDKRGILVDNAFAAFDANHDGYISFTEFVFAVLAHGKTDLNGILDFSFAVMDTSGDGRISFNELKTYLEKAMILAVGRKEASTINVDQHAKDIFRDFGLTQAQKLNKEQFIQGCTKNEELASIFTELK